MSNLDCHAVLERDILMDGLGHLMKMWIMLGRLHMEPEEVNLPNKCRVADTTIDCSQNSMEECTYKTIQIKAAKKT